MTGERKPTAPGERITSVDALRGFDMFWIVGGRELIAGLLMVFMNPLPDGLARQFRHAEWIGFTAWDLIMPLFLFIVGTSIPLSFAKRLERGQTKKEIYRHVIRRTLILFVLGMIAQGNLLDFDLSRLHVYANTLQAIACGYLIASIVVLELNIRWQGVTTAGLLVLYWLLMVLVPVPGHGAGTLTPYGNLAMFIDKIILGRFRDGTTYTWILSGLGFAGTVLLGVMAGHLLRSDKPPKTKVLWLFGAGVAGLALGAVWGIWFPIIKHIWTSSFVLFAAGWSYLLLALFYLLIDVLGYKKWAFVFVVIGMNAIAVYMAAQVFHLQFIGETLVGGLARHLGEAGKFLELGVSFAAVWLILFWMYRKKTFIKI
jgi:predicted acyltransferase